MKKIIKLLLVTSLLLSFQVGCSNKKTNKKEEKVKVNTNEKVTKDQEVEVFKFTNTSLVYEDNTSLLTTVVTNTSDEKQYLEQFKIHVKDSEGNDIVTLPGFSGDNIDAKESKTITTSYGQDLTGASSIEYEIIKKEV